MTLTSFFLVVGLIGLVAFIGTVIYFHHQDVMLKGNCENAAKGSIEAGGKRLFWLGRYALEYV